MEKQLKIGIDISKRKLDVTFIETSKLKSHAHFIVSNNQEGINEIIFKAEKQGFSKENIFVCFEHTGVYGMPLCYYLQEMNVDYSMVPALEIYRSKGITRGKNDKVDSKDIAYYAVFNAHKIEPTELPVNTLVKLKILLSFRDKLVRSIGSFQRTREVKGFMPEEIVGDVFQINEHLLKLLRKELRDLDKRINDLVKSDTDLYEKFNLAKSVVGVGKQTALHLLMYTRGFTTFDCWRKMACYAGVAPFEYSSGSSIKGKTKVSQLANKKLKSLLNMAAITAIRYDPELEKYYQRKLSEGKNPMLVINSVRCKILSRIFATVKRGTPFVKLNALAY